MLANDIIYNNFINDFSSKMCNLKSEIPYTDYIFLCVGSDKITGDAYGPIVGEKLEKYFKNFYNNIRVVGTLEKTVSGINLEKEIKEIYNTYKNPCIIAIDAALSIKEDIGKIVVTNKKMQFGKGTNKKVIETGEISIKGIVAKDCKMPKYNFNELQTTSLNIVMKLADITAKRNI